MTARRADLSGLPGWPRLLSREAAAAYLGVSPNTFESEVQRGEWPKPIRRGRRVTWDRAALDRVLDERSGLGADRASPGLESVNW